LHHFRRLIGTSVVVGGLLVGVLASAAPSGAVTHPSVSASTLTVALPPGTISTSVLPFNTQAQCYAINIDYWNLMYRPGYWFGLGNSVTVQYALSPLNAPSFTDSGSNTTVMITSKGWKWTNGLGRTETLDAQDINFWLNMDKAQKAQGVNASCGYAPGFGIPDQIVSVRDPRGLGGNTVKLTLTGHASTDWLLYNELSQIDPMPVAWDITANSGAPGSGGCSREAFASVTSTGSDACSRVFDHLQRLRLNNALWDWADGPSAVGPVQGQQSDRCRRPGCERRVQRTCQATCRTDD
jgi:peptide/nickel transport system substrate-binding protein